MTPDV